MHQLRSVGRGQADLRQTKSAADVVPSRWLQAVKQVKRRHKRLDILGNKEMVMSVKSTIIFQIEQVASEQNKKLAPLTDDLVLLEWGSYSLAIALLVARLEEVLGIDPFTASSDVYYPTTLGDFIKFYEDAQR